MEDIQNPQVSKGKIIGKNYYIGVVFDGRRDIETPPHIVETMKILRE
jgi:hypothetical protein